MLKEHAKLLDLFRKAGQVTGRKKLQKIVYISKKCHFDFQARFNFHFYGPYSEELGLQIEELTNLGFIEEMRETKNGYTQYTYTLSEKGREYLSLYPTELDALEPFVRLLNQESSRFLELVSTMLYFENLDQEALIEKVKKVKSKQNYTDEELDKAFAFIRQLKEKAAVQ
jgi:uncharacterized protein YwgA